MLTVQSMTKNGVLRVKFVEDSVGIVLMAGSKDDDFPLFCHSFKERKSIWSDRKVDLYRMTSYLDIESEICFTL